jgi:hypothetical protein
MAYRSKTYIAFDGDKDMRYYRLMTAWAAHDKFEMNFVNAHDINSARDSSAEESIKRQLRDRFANSKLFIILIGENTWRLTKFVKWEMETAVRLDLPIIAVNLNGSTRQDSLCPSAIHDTLAIYVPFREKIVTHAMEHWPDEHAAHRRAVDSGPYYYLDHIYKSLGLT